MPDSDTTDINGKFEAYSAHSSVLRGWLAAYSVGAPYLIISNDGLRNHLLKSCSVSFIFGCFGLAVLLLLIITIINKFVNWINYWAAEKMDGNENYKRNLCEKYAEWLAKSIWIDAIFDIAIVLLLCMATFALYKALL